MSTNTPLDKHTGIAAPLMRINIDTDAIIPSREMKRVSKEGLGEALFANWRYADVTTRRENPEFILNQDPYRQSSILVAGDNFGCGSSREHAVWALKDFGIRVIVAPSFGSIFYGNCMLNGILPIRLAQSQVEALAAEIEARPGVCFAVNLVKQQLSTPAGQLAEFDISGADKRMLVEGLDGIALTQKRDAEIVSFIESDRGKRPWVYR